MLLALFVLLAIFGPSLQVHVNVTEDGKILIEKARCDTEKAMRAALGEVDVSVFLKPLKKLKDIAKAGNESIDGISAFNGTGNRRKAINSAVKFWREKMQIVIRPYAERPLAYKDEKIETSRIPEDPTWNKSKEYKAAEKQIVQLVVSETNSLRRSYSIMTDTKPTSYKDFTNIGYKKLVLTWTLDEVIEEVTLQGQRSKIDAANGKFEEGYEKLRDIINQGHDSLLQVDSRY